MLAAKGFTRFKELDDRDFAEYVLIGTLLSSSLAIASRHFNQACPFSAADEKPVSEDRRRACIRKRRYRSQADALDAAMLAGVERQRYAYLCPVGGHRHLASK